MRAAAFVLASALLAVACDDAGVRESDRAMYEAIERLRRAAQAAEANRRVQLVSVQSLTARSPAAIEAKDKCVTAYRDTFDAEDAIFRAETEFKTAEAVRA